MFFDPFEPLINVLILPANSLALVLVQKLRERQRVLSGCFLGGMPTESRSFSSEKSYSPSRLIGSHEMTEWLATAARIAALIIVGGGLAEATLKDTVNYPFVENVIGHRRVGRIAFYRYFLPDCIRKLRNQD